MTTPLGIIRESETERLRRALMEQFVMKFRDSIEPAMARSGEQKYGILAVEITALLKIHHGYLQKRMDEYEKLAKRVLDTQLPPSILITEREKL